MKKVRRDVTVIEHFAALSKGSRLQFFEGSEEFDRFGTTLNSSIRNAIGHSSYNYEPVEQLITYYPKGRIGVGEERAMYLTQFARLCWDVQLHIHLNEAVYQLDKAYCMSKGAKPLDPAIIRARIGDLRKEGGALPDLP